MCLISARIEEGLVSWEKVAYVTTIDGVVEIFVPESVTQEDALVVDVVREDGENLLIEFPREASSGARRAWISKEQLKAVAT